MSKYDQLSQAELIALLEQRDRRDATRFGLVWEPRETDRDKALNDDFVALDLDPTLSCGSAPWRNLIVEGDNYDALRHLRMAFAGRVKCIYIDPPYNTGNRDFVYNDDSWTARTHGVIPSGAISCSAASNSRNAFSPLTAPSSSPLTITRSSPSAC